MSLKTMSPKTRSTDHLLPRRLDRGRVAASSSADRWTERGSGTVEWLGISALSIGLLVGLFAGLEQVGAAVLAAIRGSLGL